MSSIRQQITAETAKIVQALAEATPKDTGKASAGWHIDDKGRIVNNVPYIERLNAGSSQQAPAHFVEKTLMAITGLKVEGRIVD